MIMKFDFDLFSTLNTNQFLNLDLKIKNNNSYDYVSNNYKSMENYNFEKDAVKNIFELTNKDDNDSYTRIEHQLFHKEKKNIFVFKKINKKIGRRKHKHKKIFSIEAHHNKYKEDNIINKIKIYFTNRLMTCINKKYV